MDSVSSDSMNECVSEQPIEHALTVPADCNEIQLVVETTEGTWAIPVGIATEELIDKPMIYQKPYRVRLRASRYWLPPGSIFPGS